VSQCNYQATILSFDEVVVITANFVTGKTNSLQFVARDCRWRSWLEALLDFTGQRKFSLEPFALQSLFNQTRILNTNRRDRRQRRQYLQVIFGEPAFGNRGICI